MKRHFDCRHSWLGFLLIFFLIAIQWITLIDSLAQSPNLTIGNYIKISETRISRSVYEYTYQASITNSGSGVMNVLATATSNSPYTTIIDNTLSFGDVPANTTVSSTDTFTFRHDRLYVFSWSNLVWNISFDLAGNQPPIANAALDQDVTVGSLVTLDGRNSSDPDGDLITYRWVMTPPSGSGASLTNPASVMPTFIPDMPGEYRISLTVNDGQADSVPDEVIINATTPGPVLVTVPNVVGMTQATAQSAIVGAGLTMGSVSFDYYDTIPPGNVITQNPAGGSSAVQGSSVNIVISQQIPGGATTAWIGPSGGTITDPGGASLYIPPGALTEQRLISIETHSDILSLPAPAPLIGGVNLGPDGISFQVPVTITLPLFTELPPGTILSLFQYDITHQGWLYTSFRAVVNPDRWSASAEVTHFTDYVVIMGIDVGAGDPGLYFGTFHERFKDICNPTPTADLFADMVVQWSTKYFPVGGKMPLDFSAHFPNRGYECYEITGIRFVLSAVRAVPDPNAPIPPDPNHPELGGWIEVENVTIPHLVGVESDLQIVFDASVPGVVHDSTCGEQQYTWFWQIVVFYQCSAADIVLDAGASDLYFKESTPFKAKAICGKYPMKDWPINFHINPGSVAGTINPTQERTNDQGETNPVTLTADCEEGIIGVIGQQQVCKGTPSEGWYNSPFVPINVRSKIRSFSVTPSQETIKVGEGRILTAELIDAQGNPLDPSTVSWSSSDESIAYKTLETGGWTSVEGMDCGTVTITAKYQYDNCETVEAAARITVEDRVSYCQVNPPAITLSVGEAMLVEAIPYDAQGNEATDVENFITWSPSDDVTAWASPSIGLLTVVGANNIGRSTITATYNYPSTTKCGQKSCQAPVTVNCDLCTFNVRPSAQTLNIGDVTTLRAELLDVNGSPVNILPPSTVIWSSNSGIVSFNPATGLQTTVKVDNTGVARITATYTDMFGQKTATATITVIAPPKTWHGWSQVGNFNNLMLGADGHGNTFVAWQERLLPEEDMLPGSVNYPFPRTVYTGICLGHIGSGGITPITPCEGTVGAVLTNFFVDKMGNIIVTYYTRDVINPNAEIAEYKTWVKRYNVDSGWDETPALISHQEATQYYYYPPQALRFAADSNGNAIVVWKDYFGWYKSTIWALRYDAGQGWQSQPQFVQDIRRREIMSVIDAFMDVGIAMDSLGNAMVVWPRYLPDEDRYGIFAKRYRVDSGWDPDFRRIALPTDIGYLDIEMDSNGNAIVVWYNPDVGIRAKHYDANVDDWPPIVINIADLPSTIYGDPSPAISMDESGNAMVTYWQRDTGTSVLESPMSKGYSIDQGWGDAVTLIVNHPMPSMAVASMHGGGNATFVNVSPITTYDYASWVDGDIYYCCSTKVTWDIHSLASEFRSGEGWGETVSDTVSREFPVCYSMRYTNQQNWVVNDYVCYESYGGLSSYAYHDPNTRLYHSSITPPVIDSHGNATAVTLKSKEHWIGRLVPDPVNFEYSWMPTHYVYEYSEVIVMRFE